MQTQVNLLGQCSTTSTRDKLARIRGNDLLTTSEVVYRLDEDLLLVDIFYFLHEKWTDGFGIDLGKWLVTLQYKIPHSKVKQNGNMNCSLLCGVVYCT